MNILQVLPELNVGGVETGTVDLARELVKLGHKAVVVSSGGALVKELEGCGALHYQLPVHQKSLFSILKAVPRLAEVIRKERIEIVHARSRVPAWIAYFACRRTGKIFLTTCHGYYRKHPFSYVMGWGKRVIALSNAVARHMIDDFGVPAQIIRLIPRSVDFARFKFSDPQARRGEEFHVGMIARITPIKGHLFFIKAMAKASRHIPKLKIWVVGEATASKEAYKEQVEVLAKRLGLWHCTQFLGTQRDIPGILAHLDALVLPTITQEAFGRVIVEAQAAGVPVVATQVGGVVDIIEDGANGLLVPAQDANAIAEAVLKIYRSPELARRLAENAREKALREFNVELMTKRTLDVYQEALANSRALVIKLSSLGDIILSTAALRQMREKFAAACRISVLTSERCKEALLRCPYIDELLVADLQGKDRGWRGLWRLSALLRRRRFDFVIDLQNNRKSHLLSYLSFAPLRYGYKNKRFGFLLNRGIPDDQAAMEPVEHQFRLLKPLGIELLDPRPELWPSAQDEQYIKELLSSHWLGEKQKLVGLSVAASSRWFSKCWPPENMAQFCAGLAAREARIVLTGTPADLPRANALAAAVKNTKLINTCGRTTVNQLACLIKRCAVFVSADSSPLHIASAMRVPFVALFGPTDPKRHLPPAGRYAVIKKELLCSPCYKPQCKNNRCMGLITGAEVLEAVEKLLP